MQVATREEALALFQEHTAQVRRNEEAVLDKLRREGKCRTWSEDDFKLHIENKVKQRLTFQVGRLARLAGRLGASDAAGGLVAGWGLGQV